MDDQRRHDQGMSVRRAVLGDPHVDRATAATTELTADFQDLLEISRLTRDRDHLEPALGPYWYRRALAFASWRLQILLGALAPVLYALGRPAAVRPAGRPGPG